ncbi:ArsR family transcriptional regulator [Acidovorax sp. BLS4]|uniref:VpaChn25_0724 family phage protein n=1 Tax=Acidovorax sp. BLS4 TaxID=3273430 RepID=UPI00294233A0|nr:ArsR family transcriptional regulator [Paracidovorax avenae]WOI47732.1 ArsR family transcriptional regulator [Paracidovorax avenae]
MTTTNDFATHLAEDRRLVILRVLLESAAYTANEYLLHSMVERLGHVVSTDRIHTDLAWLKEQGLIAVDDVAGVRIGKLLARGEDAARGRTEVPGVKRPRAV